jgi:hypothetical protein
MTALCAVLLAPGSHAPASAQSKGKKVDIFWQRPDLDSLRVKSLAFMPALSFDRDLKKEHEAEDAAAAVLRTSPYRWLSPTSVQTLFKVKPAADSLWTLQREKVLRNGRVDSLAAGALCAALRVNALFTLRVDLMEQVTPEWNEAGKPRTTITCRAAVVDSLGRLLWTASGSETGEGQYHDPSAGVQGVSGSGLNQKPLTGEMGAPTYKEVATRLFLRWQAQFPRPAGAPAASPSPSSP